MDNGTSHSRATTEPEEGALAAVPMAKPTPLVFPPGSGPVSIARGMHRRGAPMLSQLQLRVSADSADVAKRRRISWLSPHYRITSLRPGSIDPSRFVTLAGPE